MAEEKKNELKLQGEAAEFFAQNPELLANLQQKIAQRPVKLNQLKERMGFLTDQMKLLKAQAELYSVTGQPMPEDLLGQVSGLHRELSRIGGEYEREFSNVHPLDLPDPDDQVLDLDGEQVPVNRGVLEKALAGDANVLKQIEEFQNSDDPDLQREGKALLRAVSESFYENQREEVRFKDNGEITNENVADAIPTKIDPVQTAPQMPDVTSKNMGILESIKNALFNRGGTAQAAVAESKSAIQKNLPQVKE